MSARVALLGLVLPLLIAGCRTVDVAGRHVGPPPICEVHGRPMTPELIRVSSGEVVYLRDYRKIAELQFPHHGGWLYSGEREFLAPYESKVRDFVCPDCDRAYREFWKLRAAEKISLQYWRDRP